MQKFSSKVGRKSDPGHALGRSRLETQLTSWASPLALGRVPLAHGGRVLWVFASGDWSSRASLSEGRSSWTQGWGQCVSCGTQALWLEGWVPSLITSVIEVKPM